MKIRKSTSHLIVSSSHLGISDDILRIFGKVKEHFDASVYHLGIVESEQETKDIKKAQDRFNSATNRYHKLTDRSHEDTIDKLEGEMHEAGEHYEQIRNTVRNRLEVLVEAFDEVTFVVPPKRGETVPDIKGATVIEGEVTLSKYLFMSGIQPVSDCSTLRPTNRNTIMALKQYGQAYSWIVPHPVPVVIPYARPGLNNVHNYYTPGILKHTEQPTKRQENYMASHSPAAILVVIDDANGEFHAVPLHVDYIEKKGYKRSKPVVLYDGLCFSADGVKEVDTKDRAMFEADDHEPEQHPGTLGAVRALNNLFKPYTFINGGDASTCQPVSRHEKDLRGLTENLRIRDMLVGLQKLLKAQTDCPSIKERILIDSNHHDWLTLFVNEIPQLKGLLDWETVAATWLPEWHVRLRDGECSLPYQFGDYTIRHGDQEPFNNAELIFPFGKYLCGHFHKYQAFRRSVSVGCGGMLNPLFMKNKIHNWQNQLTTLTRMTGITAIAPKIILHDPPKKHSRVLYRDQILEIPYYFINK